MWKQVAYTNFFELHRPDTSLSNETLGLATVTHLGDEASMVMQEAVTLPPLRARLVRSQDTPPKVICNQFFLEFV